MGPYTRPCRFRQRSIQIQVEEEHVDARLTQQSELSPFRLLLYESADPLYGNSSCAGYSWHLVECRQNADMRVEPTS